ncbi:LRR receptor-like serine/threonine-protein kinase FLS2 [Vigna unguiculata]|uniref:LRR receptor-like serine/threonine-protein kinase FLS2 n=1 Tax=Vigna unguiculata TaxID=3917 RepID=A0A4D6NGR7_VIGUN|nr:LRR receptor-like serine/threonine-protein kinase FLS2 [Vigna unguiculata]
MVLFTSKISVLLLLMLSAMALPKGNCSTHSCNENDESALLIFKQHVIDPFGYLSSWFNEDCCAWKGVQCDNVTGRVTGLDLNNQHLQGGINLSLFQIQFLTYLNLSANSFTGFSLSENFNQSRANISSLKYLDLSFNEDFQLDNLQWLSHLSSLQCLDLSAINLESQTNWLQTMVMLPSLLELRLSMCYLNNINPSVKFVNFTSLLTLDLSQNNFYSNLPYWLFNVSSDISHIDLSSNGLRGQIPKTLLNLRKLKSLRLDDNALTGPIPDWLGKHQHLQHLDLSRNNFYGSFPSSLGNLSSLTEFSVSSDSLSGSLPKSIGQLFNLRSLYIGGSFSGVLSENHFRNLSNLELLVLNSHFAFDLDPNWIPPFQLKEIDLAKTILGPFFPEWIYTQRTLETLDVSSSGISTINPDRFWSHLANVRSITLSNNKISADLSNVTLNSEYIIMNNNNFTGGLPLISTNVSCLDLSYNFLSGPISHFLCSKLGREMNTLYYLDVSNNLLSGAIPDCWENWRGLAFLMMSNNKLGGEIPPSIGLLNELIVIDLHKNNLSGNSPDIANIESLKLLDLEENNFSGVIPTKIPKSIQMMILRGNQFSGNIPAELCTLPSLKLLDLSQNTLSGFIPSCICKYTPLDVPRTISHHRQISFEISWWLLRSLDLSANNLSGEIPAALFDLTHLIALNLSRNHLVGKISSNIGGMGYLESLDLSNNHLSGEIPVAISNVSFLGLLNLSYNDFTGEIPSGEQLQSFYSWSYVGNPKLCGPPLPKNCSEEVNRDEAQQGGSNDSLKDSLYIGIGVGYVAGFCGVWYSLLLNRPWRRKYFQFLDDILDFLYVRSSQVK